MNKSILAVIGVILAVIVVYVGFSNPSVVNKDASSSIEITENNRIKLLSTLTEQLGITNTQAEGGMRSLMVLIKKSLTSTEFNQLSKDIPYMNKLLASAPVLPADNNTEGLGMHDLLAVYEFEDIFDLNLQFESLGLDSELTANFIEISLDYFSDSKSGVLLKKGIVNAYTKPH